MYTYFKILNSWFEIGIFSCDELIHLEKKNSDCYWEWGVNVKSCRTCSEVIVMHYNFLLCMQQIEHVLPAGLWIWLHGWWGGNGPFSWRDGWRKPCWRCSHGWIRNGLLLVFLVMICQSLCLYSILTELTWCGIEYEQLTKVTDTSSSQARKGKDIQGIPWDRLNITREKYRLTRLEQYRNYENIPSSGEAVDKVCISP